MHHQSKLKGYVLACVSLISMVAHADPNEVLQQTLTRTAQSGLTIQTTLAQNEYRDESYQDSYTVSVPYQDTETYYESVPYTVSEPYQDTETYYSNDYICHDYTDYEQQCHNEPYCTIVPGHDVCQTERDCNMPAPGALGSTVINFIKPGDPAPGGGGGGGGGTRPPPYTPPTPVCHDRQVCHTEGGGRECHDRSVCSNVPVTKQRCGYEQTAHTRQVTKYHDVTEYRQEQRTRQVTKYRDESRCCVTKTRQVFDHQWSLQVQVVFPQGTELTGAEKETFDIALAGTEAAPDATLQPRSTILGYRIADKKVSRGLVQFILAEVPRYKQADLSQSSVQKFAIAATKDGAAFSFVDNAQYARVSSTEQVVIQDADTHEVIAQSQVQAIAAKQVSGVLAGAFDYRKKYDAVLKIHREGRVIENGKVDFEIHQALDMNIDSASLKDQSKVAEVNFAGLTDAAALSFKDLTMAYFGVQTEYKITISHKGIWGGMKDMSVKTFTRDSLKANDKGAFVISAKDLGLSDDNINGWLTSGITIQVTMEVSRSLPDGTKAQFTKQAQFILK
jgi:hypothetical protein